MGWATISSNDHSSRTLLSECQWCGCARPGHNCIMIFVMCPMSSVHQVLELRQKILHFWATSFLTCFDQLQRALHIFAQDCTTTSMSLREPASVAHFVNNSHRRRNLSLTYHPFTRQRGYHDRTSSFAQQRYVVSGKIPLAIPTRRTLHKQQKCSRAATRLFRSRT